MALIASGILPANGDLREMRPADLGRSVRYWTMDDGLPSDRVHDVIQGKDGYLWVATSNGVARFDGFAFKVWGAAQRTEARQDVRELSLDSDGQVFARTKTAVYKQDEQGFAATSEPFPERTDDRSATVDLDGRSWWLENHKLLVSENEPQEVFQMILPVASGTPGNLYRDPQGSIWLGSRYGLVQLYTSSFTPWPAENALKKQMVWSISEDGSGTMWFAGSRGIMRLDRGRGVKLVPEGREAKSRILVAGSGGDGAIFDTQEGDIWAASTLSTVLVRTRQQIVFGALCYYDNRFWGLGEEQLWCLNDVWEPVKLPPEILGRPSALRSDNDGLLLGTDAGELLRCREGEWEVLAAPEDVGAIIDLARSDEGVWSLFSTGQLGLFSKGVLMTTICKDLGLPEQCVIECDQQDGLWALTKYEGVTWLARSEVVARMLDEKEPHPALVSFDQRDGLPSLQSDALPSSLFSSADGRIWIGTVRGVAVCDPAAILKARDRDEIPQLIIDKIFIDDVEWKPNKERLIEVGARSERVQFGYVSLDFINPQRMQYRYRLNGYDKTWIEASGQRHATYRRLSPGSYTFRVTAVNASGHWNQEGASIQVNVFPKWWERTSVKAFGVLLTGWVSLFIIRLSRKQLRIEKENQEKFSRRLLASQENERKRLAHELHDGLGQDLLGVKTRIEVLGMKHPDLIRDVDILSEKMGGIIEQTRDLSHHLRPVLLERIGLSSSLKPLVEDVSVASRIPIEYQIDELKDRLEPEVEMALYRIAQEALNNLVKHSDAGEAWVNLREERECVTLTIKDDGKGFEEAHCQNGGLGLAGIEERARAINALFHCESKKARGTRIHVSVRKFVSTGD